MDPCGPMSTSARGGYEYFINFIDDYSRYGYIYLMRHKSVAFEKFKEYKAEVKKHRGKSIKSLQSARGGEYLLGEFRQFLEDHRIIPDVYSRPATTERSSREEKSNTLRYG